MTSLRFQFSGMMWMLTSLIPLIPPAPTPRTPSIPSSYSQATPPSSSYPPPSTPTASPHESDLYHPRGPTLDNMLIVDSHVSLRHVIVQVEVRRDGDGVVVDHVLEIIIKYTRFPNLLGCILGMLSSGLSWFVTADLTRMESELKKSTRISSCWRRSMRKAI